MDTTPDPLPTIPEANSEQRGGSGGAAVPYAIIGDASQVAKRRVGVVANMMSAAEFKDVKRVTADTKTAVSESRLGPGEGLALGGGASAIWTLKVGAVGINPTGLDNDLVEIGRPAQGELPA